MWEHGLLCSQALYCTNSESIIFPLVELSSFYNLGELHFGCTSANSMPTTQNSTHQQVLIRCRPHPSPAQSSSQRNMTPQQSIKRSGQHFKKSFTRDMNHCNRKRDCCDTYDTWVWAQLRLNCSQLTNLKKFPTAILHGMPIPMDNHNYTKKW